jgi:hypothetical protein
MTRAISLLFTAVLSGQTVEEGIAAFNQGDYAAAIRTLRSAPASESRDLFLALSEAGTGKCSDAMPALERRYEAPGLRRLASLALIQCLIAADRIPDALPVAARLESEFPADADVLYQSARLHMRAFNDAVSRMYQRAPSSFRVNQLSGELFELQGRVPEAMAEYR